MEHNTEFNMGRWPKEDERSRHEARERLAELLVRAGRGDAAAIEEAYKQTSGKLYALLLEMLGEPPFAEEVLRDSFLAIWRGLARFEPGRANPLGWLVTLVRNRAIDRLRGEAFARRSLPLDEPGAPLAEPQPTLLARFGADRDRAQLYRCLDQLDGRQREAIRTAFFAGMSYEELAVRAELPAAAMKSRIAGGLVHLNAALQS